VAGGGKVQHWKHGWIPLTPWAKSVAAGKNVGPRPGGPSGGAGGSMIKSMKESGGFTFDPRKDALVKIGSVKGVAVAIPGTETVVGSGNVSRDAFIKGVADVIEKHGEKFANGAMLGGWYSPDRDIYMVEVTEVFPDRESAILAGKQRNQEGVFDLGTGDYIDTGGTGDG
jgi:hypothetical protein